MRVSYRLLTKLLKPLLINVLLFMISFSDKCRCSSFINVLSYLCVIHKFVEIFELPSAIFFDNFNPACHRSLKRCVISIVCTANVKLFIRYTLHIQKYTSKVPRGAKTAKFRGRHLSVRV